MISTNFKIEKINQLIQVDNNIMKLINLDIVITNS